jgi:hypothetical protein
VLIGYPVVFDWLFLQGVRGRPAGRRGRGRAARRAGSPQAFVYIAVGCRPRIEQLGGYRDVEVPPGIPMGVTGVVRRGERNSTVEAAEPGDVLMIPGELFAREWFRPYEQRELADVLAEIAREADGKQGGARR